MYGPARGWAGNKGRAEKGGEVMFGFEPNEVKVGETYDVGEFFWIENHVGFAIDAVHGHGLREGGGANEDCQVKVLKKDGGSVYCMLLRPAIPYGASAAHGAIFRMPVSQILSWPDIAENRREEQKKKQKIMAKIGRVSTGVTL